LTLGRIEWPHPHGLDPMPPELAEFPEMDPERVARELAEHGARLDGLDKRLEHDNARLEKMVAAARDKAAEDHEQACHRAASAIEAANLCGREVARLEDRMRGNGRPGYEQQLATLRDELTRLQDTVAGLATERRQLIEQRGGFWLGLARVVVGALALSGLGGLMWLVIAAGPRILAIWGAGGAP